MQRGEGGLDYFVPRDVEQIRDALIEVIDLGSGVPQGRYRGERLLTGAAEFGTVSRAKQNEDGWFELELFRIRLEN